MDKPNYILEINKFYDWLETNPLSKSAISLWTALMHINNKSDWKDKFTVATSVLEYKTGFKKSELFKARNELTQKNRIIWNTRGGNLSAEYEMIFFCFHNTETNSNSNSNSNGNASSNTNGTQTVTINKLNKTKLNKTKLSKSHSETDVSVIEKIENLKSEIPKPPEDLFYKKFVSVWFEFYKKQFSVKPTYGALEGNKIKSILKKLKLKCEEFQMDWNLESAGESFKQFLEVAITDKWLKENFQLAILDSKFDSIIVKALKNNGNQTTITDVFANW